MNKPLMEGLMANVLYSVTTHNQNLEVVSTKYFKSEKEAHASANHLRFRSDVFGAVKVKEVNND